MAKVMIFIGGTWLYSNLSRLSEQYGKTEYHVDFGRLPRVLASAVGEQLGTSEA